MAAVGTLPRRAAMGHGAGGLQPGRLGLGLSAARSCPLTRLPLGRGRHRRDLGRAPAAVLRAGAVERRRSDPQGADVRVERRRGQPRRGREGVLLLPRQRAQPRVHEVPVQVPAAGVPLCRPGRREPPAHAHRPGIRAPRHRHLRRRPLLRRVRRIREGGPRRHPRAHKHRQPRAGQPRPCTYCRRYGSETTGRGSPPTPGRASR